MVKLWRRQRPFPASPVVTHPPNLPKSVDAFVLLPNGSTGQHPVSHCLHGREVTLVSTRAWTRTRTEPLRNHVELVPRASGPVELPGIVVSAGACCETVGHWICVVCRGGTGGRGGSSHTRNSAEVSLSLCVSLCLSVPLCLSSLSSLSLSLSSLPPSVSLSLSPPSPSHSPSPLFRHFLLLSLSLFSLSLSLSPSSLSLCCSPLLPLPPSLSPPSLPPSLPLSLSHTRTTTRRFGSLSVLRLLSPASDAQIPLFCSAPTQRDSG